MTQNPGLDAMTQAIPPDSAADVERPSAAEGEDGAEVGTVDVAKDQVASVGQNAADAGQHVAGVAAEQARNVVAEAGSQAQDLLGQARTELREQASAQQQRLVAGLRALGDELRAMTEGSGQNGVATDLARQGTSRSHDMASWLEEREPGSLVQDLQGFARRRPGTFLLGAAGAGLLAGRLTRGVKDADSNTGNGAAGAAPAEISLNESPVGPVMPAPEGITMHPGSIRPEQNGPGL